MPVLDSIDAIVTSCKSILEELWELERGHAPSGDGHTPLDRMQLYQTLQVQYQVHSCFELLMCKCKCHGFWAFFSFVGAYFCQSSLVECSWCRPRLFG